MYFPALRRGMVRQRRCISPPCAGVWFDSEATFRPNNVASTEIIDRKTPSSEVCMANGYSSMVFDQRIFVSFNPCAPEPSICPRAPQSFRSAPVRRRPQDGTCEALPLLAVGLGAT